MFLFVCLLLAGGLQAQSVLLRGTVRDKNSYRPISDVNITVEGSTLGTSTDISGEYELRLDDLPDDQLLHFRHISYDVLTLSLRDVKAAKEVFLQPRVIPLQSTEITGDRPEGSAANELPQRVRTLEAREFEVRGYIDAGDLLRTDHSVQVDEELSGNKTVSMRGGNADEVIVLYDGLRLNSSYSNVFDMSLIELSDIERFEIIKGSNTVLFGSEAFSGVINIVPKRQRDYSIRATQQIGSYDSGIWGLQLYQRSGALAGSYGIRNGGSTRAFEDVPEDKLINSSLHHSAHVSYDFGDAPGENELRAHWRHASVRFENQRDDEELEDRDHLASLQFSGRIGSVRDLTLAASWNGLTQELALRSGSYMLSRSIDDDALQLRLQKSWDIDIVDLLFSYQFATADLDYEDVRQNVREEPVGVESARLQRQRHGLVGIGKMHGETGSDFFQTFDVDVSVRQDFVTDRRVDAFLRSDTRTDGLFDSHDWEHTLFKFAVNLVGVQEDFLLDVFLTYGNNVKYPTLMQQINSPALVSDETLIEDLRPETNRSVEIGASVARELTHPAVTGWEVSGSFFQNTYLNKFRPIFTAGIPLTLYDNVDNAQISGFEGTVGLYLFGKKILAEAGLSRYYISEQAAFPFKSESKRTLSLKLDHAGYSLQLFHFVEGEQIGLLRQYDGSWAEVELPKFSNVDLHASKYFPIGSARMFINVSLRNLLDSDEVVLSGLAIRDRRYYITAGFQY
jgi:outer membrane cobalamin receptor